MGSEIKKTKKSRPRLGRGLSALVDSGPMLPIEVPPYSGAIQSTNNQSDKSSQVAPSGPERSGGVIEVELGAIRTNPHQPRRVFEEDAIDELSRSILEHGLMQPILVRRVEAIQDQGGNTTRFELIAGERRLRACQRAGIRRIRAILHDVDDAGSAQLALIENIQREDLNPIERARGFASLSSGFGMTQEQIASKVGIRRSSVANQLRLLELDQEIQSMISSGVLSAGHGKALLSCRDVEERLALANRAVEQGWSVRMLEQATSGDSTSKSTVNPGVKERPTKPTTRLESVLLDLEKRLGEQLSTSVKLKTDRSGTKGSITIAFYDLDHFDGLMQRLGMLEDGSTQLG